MDLTFVVYYTQFGAFLNAFSNIISVYFFWFYLCKPKNGRLKYCSENAEVFLSKSSTSKISIEINFFHSIAFFKCAYSNL